MVVEPLAQGERDTARSRAGQWLPWTTATSGLLTSVAVLLLIFSGHTEAIAPVAIFGPAFTGGTAITINIRVRR